MNYPATEAKPEQTYDLTLLDQSLQKWESSAALREYYESLYRDILTFCPPGGEWLEVGSGIGVAKSCIPQLTTSDLVMTPYVEMAQDCYDLDDDKKWNAIIGVDVFHHLRFPLRFLEATASSLADGGRIILMEPAATASGRLLYGLCHHEPVMLNRVKPPFRFDRADDEEEFSNMAMAQGIFRVHREETDAELSRLGLAVEHLSYRDVAAYFFTGGFSRPALLPRHLIKTMLKLERMIPQLVLRSIGLRILIVLEKVN